ncbi:MAG: 16S rRNA (guanine(966)-N(2))-methyltransferase RsmD [Acidobacteria bacterium 13_1_20CM_3_53_8]|nr:MAG: 16S rRNA (guanine(966)-N(2))-methyltransferase RsmD [Acidobacteria bacterium 13_1_20CM_3_53_8]
MQVLAGKYRGKHLQSSTSPRVRPTARRLRETLFEILGAHVEGARVLDLCAGSGAIGIEALSRGASHATFIDRSRRMCMFIRRNLEICGVPDEQAEIVESDCISFLKNSLRERRRAWDIIFLDPPYSADYIPVLTRLSSSRIINRAGGVLVAEHERSLQLPEDVGQLRRFYTVSQGESCLSFYASV